jgi:hypothetical protein
MLPDPDHDRHSPTQEKPISLPDKSDEYARGSCQQEKAVKPGVPQTTSNFREHPWFT